MLRCVASLLVVLLLMALPAAAQEADLPRELPAPAAAAVPETAPAPKKEATAVRVANGSVSVDGVLDEAVWASVPALTDFMQKEPVQGAAPTDRMEVRFVYDDAALYIGARMYSANPAAIQAPLGRRDQAASSADHILVSLDTFLDRRTAYTFGVTASGVRLDRFHGQDSEHGDAGFDPVWEAKTRIDEEGWTAELWIPYTQLRFNDQDEQVWGLNVTRFTPSLQEEVYWVVVPRTQRGWSSRFGELRGIAGIRPTRRIEMLPFVVTSSTMDATRDRANPFDDGRNLSARFGMDMKMGVGPNLTLDATINPDFGQIEADPAEVNLTAFATRFPERRPFFSEGSQLLNLRHPNVFYSRRIGSPPVGRASGDFVDQPTTSSILGAAKLTGRLPSGYSIGVLAAVTDEEHARVYDAELGEISSVRVTPRGGYGVARVQKEFGSAGSTASVLVGGVHRPMGEDDPMALLLPGTALVYGTDALIRLGGGQYELAWAGIGSYVSGEAPAITRIQRDASHYLQRPDRTYNVLDPTLTSLTGFSMQASLNRVSGQNWLFGANTKIDNSTFDTNQIAQLNGADGIMLGGNVTYRETRPNSVFRNYSIRLNQSNEWNFAGDRQEGGIGVNAQATWLNFWSSSVSLGRDFETRSATLTRGGPLMAGAAGWRASANLGNSAASSTRISGGLSYTRDALDGWSRRANVNLSFRPSPRWQVSASPSYARSDESQQYVTTLSGGRAETFGSRYIFSRIERTTISTQVRLSFTVRPDLNFDAYAEPFAASGRYYEYGELLAPGSLDRITYGSQGTSLIRNEDGSRTVTADGSTFRLSNRDFNVRSFNSNAVLRWEWKPGSTMYLVWQQRRDTRDALGTPIGVQDAFRSVTTPGTNVLLFKTSWWLPVK